MLWETEHYKDFPSHCFYTFQRFRIRGCILSWYMYNTIQLWLYWRSCDSNCSEFSVLALTHIRIKSAKSRGITLLAPCRLSLRHCVEFLRGILLSITFAHERCTISSTFWTRFDDLIQRLVISFNFISLVYMISLLLFCARLCLNDFNSVAINSGYLKLFSRQLVETTTTICSVELSKSDCLICMTAEIIAQWILGFASVFSGINLTNLIKLALIIIWYLGSNCDFPRKKKKKLRRSAAMSGLSYDHTVPAQFAVFRCVGSQTLC